MSDADAAAVVLVAVAVVDVVAEVVAVADVVVVVGVVGVVLRSGSKRSRRRRSRGADWRGGGVRRTLPLPRTRRCRCPHSPWSVARRWPWANER